MLTQLVLFNEVSPDTQSLEIGRANAIRFNLMDGSKFNLTPTNVHNQRILLEGLQTPAPPTFSTSSSQEVRELRAIVGALVKMMGGAVTIQSHELISSNPDRLEMMKRLDPFMFVLTLKDD